MESYKLKITHFHDPEPTTGFIEVGKPEPDWVKVHSAWEARQIKPKEKDWLDDDYHLNKKGYKKALQHYEENRRRYDGFEPMDGYLYNEELDITVQFHNDGSLYLITIGESQQWT